MEFCECVEARLHMPPPWMAFINVERGCGIRVASAKNINSVMKVMIN
jgi:hypothetical protein